MAKKNKAVKRKPQTNKPGSQSRNPRLLWANPFCLLDLSSGASMTINEMLVQLVKHGYEVMVIGATVFDAEKGITRLKEHWETIRDWWHDHSEVVTVVDETGRDAVADRFINRVADAVRPLDELEQIPTDPSGAWYDAENDAGYAPADDGPVLWVQSRFYADKLEAIGKQIEYKGQLTKDLIASGALYDSSVRRTWDGVFDRRTRLFPFDPRDLGISEEDIAPVSGDNTDEVEP